AAAREIQGVLRAKALSDFGLKIQVVGGGCEGFLYDLSFTDGADDTDERIECLGIPLFIDRRALAALDGLVIDHGPTPYGAGFLFKNPRARSTCACGASFGP